MGLAVDHKYFQISQPEAKCIQKERSKQRWWRGRSVHTKGISGWSQSWDWELLRHYLPIDPQERRECEIHIVSTCSLTGYSNLSAS